MTRSVTARLPSEIRRERAARSPGPVSLEANSGSPCSSAYSTVRSPSLNRSSVVAKAPGGRSPSGQGISRTAWRESGAPNLSGSAATTRVPKVTEGRAASISLRRAAEALSSQRPPAQMAPPPQTMASRIMTLEIGAHRDTLLRCAQASRFAIKAGSIGSWLFRNHLKVLFTLPMPVLRQCGLRRLRRRTKPVPGSPSGVEGKVSASEGVSSAAAAGGILTIGVDAVVANWKSLAARCRARSHGRRRQGRCLRSRCRPVGAAALRRGGVATSS